MMISSQPLTFEILRSVESGVAPHHRSPTSATEPARQDLWASSLPERATVPLQSQATASPFLIMLLLSSGTFERGIIELAADPTPAVVPFWHWAAGIKSRAERAAARPSSPVSNASRADSTRNPAISRLQTLCLLASSVTPLTFGVTRSAYSSCTSPKGESS